MLLKPLLLIELLLWADFKVSVLRINSWDWRVANCYLVLVFLASVSLGGSFLSSIGVLMYGFLLMLRVFVLVFLGVGWGLVLRVYWAT